MHELVTESQPQLWHGNGRTEKVLRQSIRQSTNIHAVHRCYDCQGFGQITCPKCGGEVGLTPEQRRER